METKLDQRERVRQNARCSSTCRALLIGYQICEA
jgi:hypothetical protein